MTTGLEQHAAPKQQQKPEVRAHVRVEAVKQEMEAILLKSGLGNKNFIEHERSGEGLLAQGRSSGGDQV